MAYSYSTSKATYNMGGRVYWVLTVTELAVTGATDEYTLTGLPVVFQVINVSSTLTPGSTGSATTVDPQLGDLTNTNNVFENTTAGATTNEYPSAAKSSNAARSLFGRSKANGTIAGAGSPKIVTRIVLVEGLI